MTTIPGSYRSLFRYRTGRGETSSRRQGWLAWELIAHSRIMRVTEVQGLGAKTLCSCFVLWLSNCRGVNRNGPDLQGAVLCQPVNHHGFSSSAIRPTPQRRGKKKPISVVGMTVCRGWSRLFFSVDSSMSLITRANENREGAAGCRLGARKLVLIGGCCNRRE